LDLLGAVLVGKGEVVLAEIEKMASITPDFEAATDALISLLHKMAVLQIIPKAEEEDEAIKQLASQLSQEDVQLYYQIALHGRRDLSLSPDPRSGFEMIFLRLLTFRPLRDIAPPNIESSNRVALDQQIKTKVEKIIIEGDVANVVNLSLDNKVVQSNPNKGLAKKPPLPPVAVMETNKESFAPSAIMDAVPPWHLEEPPTDMVANHESLQAQKQQQYVEERSSNLSNRTIDKEVSSESKSLEWHDLIPKLNLTGRAAELIRHCVLNDLDGSAIHLSLDKYGEDLLAKSTQLQIETALAEYYNKPVKLLIDTKHLSTETPADRTARKRQEDQQVAEDLMKNDPFVKNLQSRFNAQIVQNSVKLK
jgi:DNA polymerase-3 subunit gamma/tau